MTAAWNTRFVTLCHLAVLVCAALVAGPVPLRAEEPKVPPAPPPDGVAVAILGPGVDYRVPLLRQRLARDGEGDLISWDFADGDMRPFEDAVAGHGTRFALAVLEAHAAATLVIVREKAADPKAFGHMMSFVARTPARIVVWPGAQPARPDWPILVEAATHFKNHLFIVPRAQGGKPGPFAALAAAANVILVDAAKAPVSAAPVPDPLSAAAGTAARLLSGRLTRPMAEVAADIRDAMAASQGAQNPAKGPSRAR